MKAKEKILVLDYPSNVIKSAILTSLMILFTSALFAQKKTVVDVVVNSKDHQTLEAAVIAAELADDLSGEGPFTVFAPTDAAFAALPEGTIDALLKDPKGDLASILLYHVVAGNAMSSDLSNGQSIATLNGDKIDIKIKDGKVYVDKARVTSADIKTDNGIVHVIDAVITPSAAMAEAGSAGSGSAKGGGCGN